MPTYERREEFLRDLLRLTPEQRAQFDAAVSEMVEDLRAGRPFRTSLRIKRFHSVPGYYEMSYSGDGRAFFEYGTSPHEGDVHIIWRRVGTHKLFRGK
jgi:hypothetical protein